MSVTELLDREHFQRITHHHHRPPWWSRAADAVIHGVEYVLYWEPKEFRADFGRGRHNPS